MQQHSSSLCFHCHMEFWCVVPGLFTCLSSNRKDTNQQIRGCNKVSQTRWFKTTEICCLRVLGATSLKAWCSWGHGPTVQFSSVAQSCPTFCDPMNLSTSGLPVHHQLPEFTQTQVHRVSDAIQPSHPLLSPSLPAPNPSQHQSLFQ